MAENTENRTENGQPQGYVRIYHGTRMFPRGSRQVPFDFSEFYGYVSRYVKGQEELVNILAVVFRYVKAVYRNEDFTADRMLLAGPSSSGKTYTFQIIREYFRKMDIDIPVMILDTTAYTENGFKGKDTDDMYAEIINAAPHSHAIVVMDEFDKRLIPSFGASGTDYNRAFQGCMLHVLGGEDCTTRIEGIPRTLVARETFFVMAGAFSDLRGPVGTGEDVPSCAADNYRRTCVGFVTDEPAPAAEESTDTYRTISREDIIARGAMTELIGRINYIYNLKPLDRDAVAAQVREYVEEIGETLQVCVTISERALADFVDLSYGDMGLRHTKNTLLQLVNDAVARSLLNPCSGTSEYRITGPDSVSVRPFRKARPQKPPRG